MDCKNDFISLEFAHSFITFDTTLTFRRESMAKAATKTDEKQRPLTKTQIVANIAEKSGLAKKDVAVVIDQLGEEIKNSLGKKGPGSFVLPGLVKIDKKIVKAQPAKKGVKNSLTGQLYDRPAKPAHKKIRVRPLKALKEIV